MNKGRSKVDTAFVLMILCAFALSVFVVLMLSANIYSNMVERSNHHQDERIALSFVRTMVRSADSQDVVSVGSFHGLSALIFEEEFEGFAFVTKIYFYNGWVYELFMEQGENFLPDEGMPIIRADFLDFEMTADGMVQATNGFGTILVSPRSA